MADEEDWSKDLPWLGQYILDENGKPVRARGLLEWGRWLQEHDAERQLALDQIGAARVSTIFLGLDSFSIFQRDQPHEPVLWETMVFGGPYNLFQQRYTSKEEALKGHGRIVQMLTS
jgi:hypothetical protein